MTPQLGGLRIRTPARLFDTVFSGESLEEPALSHKLFGSLENDFLEIPKNATLHVRNIHARAAVHGDISVKRKDEILALIGTEMKWMVAWEDGERNQTFAGTFDFAPEGNLVKSFDLEVKRALDLRAENKPRVTVVVPKWVASQMKGVHVSLVFALSGAWDMPYSKEDS